MCVSVEFEISPEIRVAAPELEVVILEADVVCRPTEDSLQDCLDAAAKDMAETFTIDKINKRPAIAATRKTYKALGKEPNRYRPSAEALCRRCVKGVGLYRTLNIIDLINLVSIKTGHSIGGFDRDNIDGNKLVLGVGQENEPYEAIGRGQLNIAYMPVIRDATGGIGTPTSDNDRTKLSTDTRRLLMTINKYGNSEPDSPDVVELVIDLLTRHADATNIRYKSFHS